MNDKKALSQSINILDNTRFKENLLNYVNPNIKEEYELYIEDLVKILKKQEHIKSLEKNKNSNNNKKEEKKKITKINLSIIQYILNKRKRSADELLIIKCFLGGMDFLSLLSPDAIKDKLLFSLSKYLKLEKKPQNYIIFRYGNKGNKFYIVFSGELSVLILKEVKVQTSYIKYFMHLLILKLLKEDDLVYKIISCNYGFNRVNKNEFDFYYDNINKFINKHFGKFSNKNRYFIVPDNNTYEIYRKNTPSFSDIYNNSTLNDIDVIIDSEGSSSEEEKNDEEEEEEEKNKKNDSIEENKKNKIYNMEELNRKKEKRNKRREILKQNPLLLNIYNISKKLNYSEILISQMEIKKIKYIVLYFIFCREIILSKKQYNSINEYIDYTFLNSPMHLSCNLDNIYFDKEQFTLFQYFEIAKKKQGDTFGELALQHDDNKRTGTIITLSDTVLGYLTKNDYNLSLSDIELKKRKKDVNFIMSFSIFSQMNWYVFENKYFNFFKKETFSKGEKIMLQGEKNKKLYFIMDGLFEITTTLTLKKLYFLLKFKMGDDFDIKEKPTHYKKFNLRLYISYNKDILGLNDCYINNGISFVDATCISVKSTVLTLDISILNELKEKNPEIKNDLKKMVGKKEKVMIERLKMIYYKSIQSFNIFKIERNSKSSYNHKRIQLDSNNKDKKNNESENGNKNNKEDNDKKIYDKNYPLPTITNTNINLFKFFSKNNQDVYKNEQNMNYNNIYNEEKKFIPQNIDNSLDINIINNKLLTEPNKIINNNNRANSDLIFINNKIRRKENDNNQNLKLEKINKIMQCKSMSPSNNKKFVLKTFNNLNVISNKHTKKKLIELYSPLNNIINKEYSNLFNWIDNKNNSSRNYNVCNTEEKSTEFEKYNNNKLEKRTKKDFLKIKKKSNKINIKQILKLNNYITMNNKRKNNEESYNYISNDSSNKEKINNKTMGLNKQRLSNTFSCKKIGYKIDLDFREKRLKKFFAKFLKNVSGADNKAKNKKEKLNIKKDCIKFNVINNLKQNQNKKINTLSDKKVNVFLCSDNTKKEYGFESPKNTINNHILSYFYPNSLNNNENLIIK